MNDIFLGPTWQLIRESSVSPKKGRTNSVVVFFERRRRRHCMTIFFNAFLRRLESQILVQKDRISILFSHRV